MLRFLKRPEVVYSLVLAVLTALVWLALGEISAYIIFFLIYGPFIKAPLFVLLLACIPLALYRSGGAGLKNGVKWVSLTFGGFLLGTAGLSLIMLAPTFIEQNMTWNTAYTYRFILEVDTADGVKELGQTITVEKKTASLKGKETGQTRVRGGIRMTASYNVAEGVYVGFPSHRTGVFNSLYTETLRRLKLPLEGEYEGRRLEVDRDLFPRVTAHHIKYYDEQAMVLYQNALAGGDYRIYVELVSGTPVVFRSKEEACEYLLTLLVETPDGPKRSEVKVRLARDGRGQTPDALKLYRISGFLRIPLRDGAGLSLELLPHELAELPRQVAKAENMGVLTRGSRVPVPRTLLETTHFGGLQLKGDKVFDLPESYRPLMEGRGEYTLWLEMINGNVQS